MRTIHFIIRTDRQADMARSTRLVILIKNINTLWGRKRFLLPVTYFSTNLVYPFTLRETGITRRKAKVACHFYQIPISQLNKQERYSRRPRLLNTGYSAKGSAREMDMCMRHIGCFRDCKFYMLKTFL